MQSLASYAPILTTEVLNTIKYLPILMQRVWLVTVASSISQQKVPMGDMTSLLTRYKLTFPLLSLFL